MGTCLPGELPRGTCRLNFLQARCYPQRQSNLPSSLSIFFRGSESPGEFNSTCYHGVRPQEGPMPWVTKEALPSILDNSSIPVLSVDISAAGISKNVTGVQLLMGRDICLFHSLPLPECLAHIRYSVGLS